MCGVSETVLQLFVESEPSKTQIIRNNPVQYFGFLVVIWVMQLSQSGNSQHFSLWVRSLPPTPGLAIRLLMFSNIWHVYLVLMVLASLSMTHFGVLCDKKIFAENGSCMVSHHVLYLSELFSLWIQMSETCLDVSDLCSLYHILKSFSVSQTKDGKTGTIDNTLKTSQNSLSTE